MFSRLLALLTFFITSALADDVNGRWYFDYGYYMEFVQAGNTFTGTGGEGSSYTWEITDGVINGNTISWKESYNEIAYLVDRVGTINGDTITGTWSSSWGQNGDFVATKAADKRPTSTFVFCNRTSVGLSVADCYITVGDAGAPPRQAPTGTVKLFAANGFFPAEGSCALQQTSFSPGVGSCRAEFAIPFGYPIGVPFPIDAEYPGDLTFAKSGSKHNNIEVSCVGDPENPCSGNVGLTFADWPQIYKNFFKPVIECGNYGASTATLKGLFGNIGKCIGNVTADTKLGELLAGLDFPQIQALAGAISNKDAKSDPFLKAIQALDDTKNIIKLQEAMNDAQKLNELMRKILLEQQREVINNLPAVAYAKKPLVFVFGSTEISIKNNSVKQVRVKLTKPAKKLIAALKKAGVGDINVNILMKGSRANKKKKFKKKYAVNMGLSS